ncbi:MAG: DNA primase [Alphaproteobacteria bacterium]
MARITPEFLEELRSRFTLSEVIGQRVALRRQGAEHGGLCPFHKEKSPSFSVNDQKGVYYCFGCKATGDVVRYTMDTHHLSFPEAVEDLARKAGLSLPESHVAPEVAAEKRETKQQLQDIMLEACRFFRQQLLSPEGTHAKEYVFQRGLTAETVNKFGLGYAPKGSALKEHFLAQGVSKDQLIAAGLLVEKEGSSETYDRFRDRLMFPIVDTRGNVIAFGGRILGDGKPKYLNSPETDIFSKSHNLYGLYQAKEDLRKQTAKGILVEGYMDVIALYQAGYRGAVAPLGTALTPSQIQLLWRYTPEPIMCFDGDTAGQTASFRAAERVLPILRPGFSINTALLPKGEDPDTMVRSGDTTDFEKLLSTARPLQDILWEKDVLSQPMKTPEQKALVRRTLMAQVKLIEDPSVRFLYQQEFDQRFFHLFRKNKGKSDTSAVGVGIHTHMNKRKAQIYLLFATLINNPQLIDSCGEAFTDIDLNDEKLDMVRDCIISEFISTPGLDSEALRHHIIKQGMNDILSEILDEGILVHGSFARPSMDLAKAEQGWQEVWQNVIGQKALNQDLEQMRANLSADLTPEAWNKFQQLKTHVLRK